MEKVIENTGATSVVCELCGIIVPRNDYDRHIGIDHREKKEAVCHICFKKFTSNKHKLQIC